MKKILYLCMCLFVLAMACGDSTIVTKTFECEDNKECKKDQVCEAGKCVKGDNDNDGFGRGRDCNDNNKDIYPGAPEICENKTDDNCDGKTDEQPCKCIPGTYRPCGATDEGNCKKGKQVCERNGQWSTECVGENPPQKEDCNGKDDDCDGQVDEDLKGPCYDGPSGTKDLGLCKGGTRACKNGQWGKCEGAVKPIKEKCNGEDDDCDALVDNGIEEECYDGPPNTKGRGVCKAGKKFCVAGKMSECKGTVGPKKEDCNGQDDDCNGQVDENLSGACYNGPSGTAGKGPCRAGKRSCDGGKWTKCIGEITPGPKDDCQNKKDLNCDGVIDKCSVKLFQIRTSINTDTGKIDGILSAGWQRAKGFSLKDLEIPAGVRVTVKGSTPLTLKVVGRVEIKGTLDASGKDGGSTNCTASASGGAGTGGGSGGSGGSGGACNTQGSQPAAGSGSGLGAGKGGTGSNGNGFGGGGGGAGHSGVGTNGLPAGVGGKGGLPVGSATTVSSGSGGGGGACGAKGSSILGIYTPGAGGGGGGGAVHIISTTDTVIVSGNILVNGGDGGTAPKCGGGIIPSSATGGGGGGGSGGTVWIRAKKQVIVQSSAFITAKGGVGNGQATAKGGNGSNGRIVFADADAKITYPAARVSPLPTLKKY